MTRPTSIGPGGFTLIEVLIVVAIVGILAAIAIPNYSSYVMRGKIQEATTNLLGMRTKLEQYFDDNRTYVGACAAGTVAPLPTGLKYFTITCPTLTQTTYTVQAEGGITGGDRSMAGFTYTIDQANSHLTPAVPSGWGSAPVNCWVVNKGGQC